MSGSVIMYINTDGYEYRARCTGELNSQKTTIKGRWVNGYHETKGPWGSTLSLFDHGNGAVVEAAQSIRRREEIGGYGHEGIPGLIEALSELEPGDSDG